MSPTLSRLMGRGNGFEGVAPKRRFVDWLSHPAALLLLAALIGLVLGFQFFQLNPRVVKSTIALMVLFLLVRFPVYVGVGVFLVVYPFPSAIFIGNTNFVFAVLLIVIWIIKFSLGMEPLPRSTLLGGGMFFFILANLVSLTMLPETADLVKVAKFQQFLVAALFLYAVMVNSVDTSRRLHFIFQAMTFSSLVIYLLSLQDWAFPSLRLIPEWYIVTIGKGAHEGGRAAGVYESHSLLADSAAVNVIIQLFLLTRARKLWRKIYHGLVGILAVAMISLSVNRGGFVILVVGLIMLVWYLRRDIRFSYVAVVFPVVGFVFFVAEGIARGRLHDISLFSRLASTRLSSFMPEHRAVIWADYFQHIKESPILGHGPWVEYADFGVWPHNAYIFYWYTLGIVGLAIFLWILFKAVWATRPRGPVSWIRGSYAKGASLVAHIGLIMGSLGQLRSDHQRGNEEIYFMYTLLALAAISWSVLKQENRAQMSQGRSVDNSPQKVVS